MAEMMSPKLSVNVNKIATIRNARGGNNPNVLQVALDCERFGAQGITVHPRPDERHIRFTDVHDLSANIATEFNIEGYPSEDFLQLIEKVKPHQVTLVPDPPHVLTSNAGWDTVTHQEFLIQTIARIKQTGARVSIFLDPNPALIASAKATGTDRIELYTEAYASQFHKDPATAIAPYVATANAALEVGLGINAGHDLDLHNLAYLAQNLPGLQEVSIGHALVCDALYHGLQNTIQLYLRALKIH